MIGWPWCREPILMLWRKWNRPEIWSESTATIVLCNQKEEKYVDCLGILRCLLCLQQSIVVCCMCCLKRDWRESEPLTDCRGGNNDSKSYPDCHDCGIQLIFETSNPMPARTVTDIEGNQFDALSAPAIASDCIAVDKHKTLHSFNIATSWHLSKSKCMVQI